jgi:phosphoglycolate phosphatase-like HAD superfamily hydrolase
LPEGSSPGCLSAAEVGSLLLLFDVDGTLLGGASDAHRDALHAALRAVHGIDAAAVGLGISAAGRTDGEIARAILLDAGISSERIDGRGDAVQEACCRAYARLCPSDLSGTVLPGIHDLLAWLADADRVAVGLLTGNYEAIARLKVARAGIGSQFPAHQGAFGSDSEDRAALPAIARRRAGARGTPHARERTILIGDTPRDIACARADGLRCVAVASGPFRPDDLCDADAVARDGTELRSRLEELGV